MTRRLKNRSGFNISFKRLLLLSNSFLGKDNIIHAMILQDDKKRSENKWNSFLEKNYYFLFRSLENDSLSLENFHSQNRVTRGGKSCKERIRYTRDGFRSSKERWILEIPRVNTRREKGEEWSRCFLFTRWRTRHACCSLSVARATTRYFGLRRVARVHAVSWRKNTDTLFVKVSEWLARILSI